MLSPATSGERSEVRRRAPEPEDSKKPFVSEFTQRIGDRVKYYRTRVFKMSQSEFATKLGISQSLVAKMEGGKVPITLDRIEEIASIFKMEAPEEMFKPVTLTI